MRRLLELTLGILTAIGAFVDIGDFVANAETGARFGMGLAWAVLLGTLGICLYAEMAGRIAALSQRATFDVIRERLGARLGAVSLGSGLLVNFLTLAAEIGGLALLVELITGLNYLLWVIPMAVLAWFVMWRVKFSAMERTFGLMGLAMLVIVAAFVQADPSWSELTHQATHPVVPSGETHATYWYWAVSLLGATMTVYEPYFFSSGAIEEKWGRSDVLVSRANVYIGFPLGAVISLALMALAAMFLKPQGIEAGTLAQASFPVAEVFGKGGLALIYVGLFAALFGAALETGLSSGYVVAQYFGWEWGKKNKPKDAPRFHLVVMVTLILATALILTSVDPIKVTEFSIILVAIAAPTTYLPILILANDPRYVGDKTNSIVSNVLATIFFVILLVASLAAIPLLIITKGGA